MKIKFRHIILIILVVFVLAARFSVSIGEWYSTTVYPLISAALSWLVSWITFSLEEVAVIGSCGFMLCLIVYCIRQRVGLWKTLLRITELLLWIYVWIYIAWGCNYFRADLYTRTGSERQAYDESVFKDFVHAYTDGLNAAYASFKEDEEGVGLEQTDLEAYVKQAYSGVQDIYGLSVPRPWQHPKDVLLKNLYSSVGVLGYIGPFFCETQLNPDLLPDQYPFIYAHEYSHLMGVSNEAEANYWAYQICIASDYPSVKYSGYYSLLPYVLSNASRALTADEYRELLSDIHPDILSQYSLERNYWNSLYSPLLGKIQSAIYNAFLKGNKIPSGTANYLEVIDMIISVPSAMESSLPIAQD